MIGRRIKELRESQGITQTDLAFKIHESKQTLYKYENDIITNIPSDKIELIADVLGCSPAYLMGWEEPTDTDEAKRVRELYAKIDPEILERAESDPKFRELIQLFLQSSDDDQDAILKIAKGLLLLK